MSEARVDSPAAVADSTVRREKPGGADALRHILTIAKREVTGYFESPVAYVFIVIFLLLSGFFTFMVADFFERGQANLMAFFAWHPWLYLLLVPAVGMRMWSEERRLGTIELLLTMPITPWQAIVGKFLASWLPPPPPAPAPLPPGLPRPQPPPPPHRRSHPRSTHTHPP